MSIITRRQLFARATAAGAIASISGYGAFRLYNEITRVYQLPFPFIDPKNPSELVRQSIQLLRQTETGERLYKPFADERLVIRPATPQDQMELNALALYNTDSKEILFATAKEINNTVLNQCLLDDDTKDINNVLRCGQRSFFNNIEMVVSPQPAVLAHELTHFHQDKYSIYEFTRALFMSGERDMVQKIYFLSEAMGDLMAIRTTIELVNIMPDKEAALIINLAKTTGAVMPYVIISGALRDGVAENQIAPIYRRALSELIASGRYAEGYEQRVNTILNATPEVNNAPPLTARELNSYCELANHIVNCDGFLTSSYLNNLSFNVEDHTAEDIQGDEARRVSNILKEYFSFSLEAQQKIRAGSSSSVPNRTP